MFFKLLKKYGLKTALDNYLIESKITWRNKRLWKMWKRNTNIIPMAMLIILAIGIITTISLAITYQEIRIYQLKSTECPTIRRILPTAQEYPIIIGNISAYNALPEQTDDTPCITADGTNICGTTEKIVANNCLPFNTIVEIDGIEYRVADRLHKRFDCSHYDLLFARYDEAIQFGRQTKQVIIKI